jgi:hypothetical protein
MICCLTRDSFARAVNEGGFGIKFGAVVGTTFLLFFLDNDHLRVYVQVAAYCGVLFLVYQNISLVDFGYIWNEKWLQRYEDGNSFYGFLLLAATVGMLVLTVLSTVSNFDTYWRDGCAYYKTNLIISVMLLVGMVVLAVLQLYRSSSVLTATFIALVFTYFNGYALASFPDATCNPFHLESEQKSNILDSLLHIGINIGAGILTVLCLSVDAQPSQQMATAGLAVNPTDDEADKDVPILGEDTKHVVPAVYQSNYYIWFHFVMAVFSVYLVMIFFDWRDLNLGVEKWSELLAPSPSAFYIKTFASFLFLLLYVWTLLAPAFISEREFD